MPRGVCHGVSAQEGCLPRRGVCLGGVCPGGVNPRGVCRQGGV